MALFNTITARYIVGMEDVCAPTLSLNAAADAAGLRPGYVRSLLVEARIVMLGQPSRLPHQPNRAATVDVLRLTVLRRLRDAGLSDEQAVYVLDLAVDPLLGGLCLCGLPIPRAILIGRLQWSVFHVTPHGDELPGVYSTPSGYPAPDAAAVVITVNLLAVLADVLDRLNAHTSTAAKFLGRSTGGRAGAAAGSPTLSTLNSAGTPAMES